MGVGIVLVTFNRLKDLKITLAAYEMQTVAPDFVLVVDNNSNDGTGEYLSQWQVQPGNFPRKVLSLPENLGGSGGFHAGMCAALETDCQWVFVADDDAVPHEDMLEKLLSFEANNPQIAAEAAALCTAVNNKGRREGIHRCRINRSIMGFFEKYVPECEYEKPYFYADIYSFVGTMIRREALLKAGPARGDFFIYNDDYEHAVRVGKQGKIICVPESVMDHVDNLNYEKQATWRDYYATRNAVIMHRTHFGFWGGLTRALRRLAVAVSTLNPQKIKVIWTGIVDGYADRTGKHPVYVPGWKAK